MLHNTARKVRDGMGVVNQRVCDLEDCAQPITAKTGAVFIVPEGEDGEPDVERKIEFQSKGCAKKWLRGADVVAKDARIRTAVAAIPSNETGRAAKVAEMEKKLSKLNASAYAFPESEKATEPEGIESEEATEPEEVAEAAD